MKLHVVTACSRPRNLNRLAVSLRAWGDVDYEWHIRFDLEQRHVGGQAVKNAILDSISDGWVWFLDDDTLAHPNLYRRVSEVVANIESHWAAQPAGTMIGPSSDGRNDEPFVLTEQMTVSAVVFDQIRQDDQHFPAARENVGVGSIDIGQAVIRRDQIGDHRIPEEYAGDGEFLMAVLDDSAVFLSETLSFHNKIRP